MSRSYWTFGDVFRRQGGCYRQVQVRVRKRTAMRDEAMAKSKLRILYGEGDGEVLVAQAAQFQKAGHTVQQAEGRKAVEAALKSGSFDLVVLGATLTRNDRHHLPYMVKKASDKTNVLVMHADGTRHHYVDACTDTGASMENVLARIEAMNLAGTTSAAAAAGAGR
jgi:DNA-binding response OmpR family regulator